MFFAGAPQAEVPDPKTGLTLKERAAVASVRDYPVVAETVLLAAGDATGKRGKREWHRLSHLPVFVSRVLSFHASVKKGEVTSRAWGSPYKYIDN
ncbi:hypothetical protein P4S72_09780 [Vibrio sp. PP-XX7]